jgi:hypothetical protein
VSDLATFLLARIAEDRAAAEAATPGVWKLWGMSVMAAQDGTSNADTAVDVARTAMRIDGKPRTFDAQHIARWDPARVLAECEVKRRIVERVSDVAWATYSVRDVVLELLALPYADHPDYRSEWTP